MVHLGEVSQMLSISGLHSLLEEVIAWAFGVCREDDLRLAELVATACGGGGRLCFCLVGG